MPTSISHYWHCQPFGTPWKSPAIYHVTFSVADHHPLLGRLVMDGDISSAYIERSDLGKAVVRCIARMTEVFPQIRLLKYTVMESLAFGKWIAKTDTALLSL